MPSPRSHVQSLLSWHRLDELPCGLPAQRELLPFGQRSRSLIILPFSPRSKSQLWVINRVLGCPGWRGQWARCPFHGVSFERADLIALKALEAGSTVRGRHDFHALDKCSWMPRWLPDISRPCFLAGVTGRSFLVASVFPARGIEASSFDKSDQMQLTRNKLWIPASFPTKA
jgi:hypothetical protein